MESICIEYCGRYDVRGWEQQGREGKTVQLLPALIHLKVKYWVNILILKYIELDMEYYGLGMHLQL